MDYVIKTSGVKLSNGNAFWTARSHRSALTMQFNRFSSLSSFNHFIISSEKQLSLTDLFDVVVSADQKEGPDNFQQIQVSLVSFEYILFSAS